MKNYIICAIAALAGLLFGYDVGVISGAILFITPEFHLTPAQVGTVVGLVPLGALLDALLCGKISDAIGRKVALIITALLFFVGSIICALSLSLDQLMLGRFMLGLAVGLGSFSAPLYISEIAHKSRRGGFVTLNQLAITLGILLSYTLNYYFALHANWRWMVGFGAVLALILLVLTFIIPRSPRWLMSKGRTQDAQSILVDLHGQVNAREEMAEISSVLQEKSTGGWRMLMSPGFKKVLFLGVFVSIFTQAVGINAIIYYAPHILEGAGFTSAAIALLATIGIGAINTLFTCVSIVLLDRMGRRFMLLMGLTGIACCLAVISLFMFYGHPSVTQAWVIMSCMGLFVAFQALSTGPACWLIPAEIFPLRVRGLGVSISVAFNWGTNVIIAMFFPSMMLYLKGGATFAVFLCVALIAICFCYFFLPETKGVSLETIEKNTSNNVRLRDLAQVSE